MSLLSGYKINKAISIIVAEGSLASNNGRQAAAAIRRLGTDAVPRILEALPEFGSHDSLIQLLAELLTDETLSLFTAALKQSDPSVLNILVKVLAKSNGYNPNRLLPLLEDSDLPRNSVGEILLAQKDKLEVNKLLQSLDKVSSSTRPILYRLLDIASNENDIPNIVSKTNSNEALVRSFLATLLSKFENKQAKHALTQLLADSSKAVRQSALQSLAKINATDSVELICQCLSDPDMTVQSTAIETLCKLNAPDTVKYLIDVLQDESEYVRRAAVEVLNVIGNQSAIKDLLNALRDADWWVKVRAADALGSIGGPKVFEAVIRLIKDPDEFMRRTAVEILNTSKDIKAFDKLVEALKDEDWWVRERAADALAGLGDKRAVQPLLEMLERSPEASQVVLRALTTIGDSIAVAPILGLLRNKQNRNTQKDALLALKRITDEKHREEVQSTISQLIGHSDEDIGKLAEETIQSLIKRFGGKPEPRPRRDANAESTLREIFSKPAVEIPAVPSLRFVDAAKLVPGDLFANRYRVIDHIGKGAFGIVVLVEDIIVHDQFILKILSPHVASDDYNIKRFTQELRYARRVTHKNVIRIYDFIKHDSSYAISMEYFPSHSLRYELANRAVIRQSRAIHIIKEICEGMSAAQAAGVIHRDLKPGNILIDDKEFVKIVDFGLAAAASQDDSRLTKTGLLVGTPTYMAPEQVRGKEIDSRTDIYALGVIMYELFTGVPPYRGEDSMSVMFQHVEAKLRKPSLINPDLTPSMEQIILKCMALQPKDRFQSFNALKYELSNLSAELV